MNRERLLKLADYLESEIAKTPKLFNMDEWGKKTECGTVCCAAGHAATMPEFQAEGLRLSWSIHGSADLQYGELHGFDAIEDFFRITPDDAYWLFYSREYSVSDEDGEEDAGDDEYEPEIWEVVERIRDFAN